jgi:hypothetical protein
MQTQPNSYNTHNEWATSLCDCCSDPQESRNQCCFFCSALWCQCAAQGTLQQHAGLSNDCCGPCCCYCCFSEMLVPQCALFNLHRAVIDAEKIEEGCMSSLFKVICCFACTMNQLNSHFILKNKRFNATSGDCCMHLMGCVNGAQLVEAVPHSESAVMPAMTNSMTKMQPMPVQPPPPMMPPPMMPPPMPVQPVKQPAAPPRGLTRPTTMGSPPKSVPSRFSFRTG